MRIRFNTPAASLALSAVLAVAACSSAATPVPTVAPTTVATAGPSAAPTATPLPGTKKFTVAFTSRGISSVAMMEAIDTLNKAGYTIDYPEVAQSNLIVQGIVDTSKNNGWGQFQVTSGTTLSFLVASQANGAIRTIGNRLYDEWTLAAINSIQKCDDTNGKIWAHHTESAVSTAMARIWKQQNCSAATTPQEIMLQGSDVRRKALIAGQVDISDEELGDAYIATTGDNASKFHVVVTFKDIFPNLQPSLIAANSNWLAANPGDAIALLAETIKQNRKINADPTGAYLKSLAQKWVPNTIDAATIDTVAKAYVAKGLFPSDGGMKQTDIDYTIKFFTDGGQLNKGLTTQQATDLTFLNLALQQVGPAPSAAPAATTAPSPKAS